MAWGPKPITAVEVKIDNGPWTKATLDESQSDPPLGDLGISIGAAPRRACNHFARHRSRPARFSPRWMIH